MLMSGLTVGESRSSVRVLAIRSSGRVRALRRVEEADLVLYDALVDAEALRRLTRRSVSAWASAPVEPASSRRRSTGSMIRAARQGKRVVRLKGGDPFVFGRGAEEMLALAHAGIAVEVVPGVTTAVAAPEAAGIPVTHREHGVGFLVLTGQTGEGSEHALSAVRPAGVTVVVMMGLASRDEIAREFIDHGWPPDTPAAIVCGASTREEWVWTGTLAELGSPAPARWGGRCPGRLGKSCQSGKHWPRRTQVRAAADEVRYGRS